MWKGKKYKTDIKKNWIKPKWYPQTEERFYLGASRGGSGSIEVYFTYDLITLLLKKIVHKGDFSAIVSMDNNVYNLENEFVDISDLLIYMEEDEDGNLIPETSYSCKTGEI